MMKNGSLSPERSEKYPIGYICWPDCDEIHIVKAGDFLYSIFKRNLRICSETTSISPGWSGDSPACLRPLSAYAHR